MKLIITVSDFLGPLQELDELDDAQIIELGKEYVYELLKGADWTVDRESK